MREIQFRGWDKTAKKWIGNSYLEYLCVSDGVVVLVTYEPDNNGGYSPKSIRQLTNPEVDNLEIVQFTGLRDKNGVEIYDGDILEYTSSKCLECGAEHRYPNHKLYPIKWNQKTAAFDCENDVNYMLPDVWSTDMEVIGNIYANSELLAAK